MIRTLRVGKKTRFRFNKESLSRSTRASEDTLEKLSVSPRQPALLHLCFPITLGEKTRKLRLVDPRGPQHVSISAFVELTMYWSL